MIVTLHNDLKIKHKNAHIKKDLKSNNLNENFRKFSQNIMMHKKYFEEINFTETQIFRRNSNNLNCERHHELYNKQKLYQTFVLVVLKFKLNQITFLI